jgi:predicted dienelactone hydrolase
MLRLICLRLTLAAISQDVGGQSTIINIPAPSGPFSVGRVSYDWVDQSRSEGLSKVPNARREIMVDVWYPADARLTAAFASYFPHAAQIDKSSAAEAESNNWGALWMMVASGKVHAEVYEGVPAAGTRFPLIIFSHAFNGEPWAYTHEIKELVSHGYVVATIHHTYEVTVAAFPDGRMVPFSAENARGTEAPSLEEALKWAEPRIDVWAADIRFTLDQLTRLNADAREEEQKGQKARLVPFAGRLDLDRIGVIGHSFGGVAAERACELDLRIKACLNQDGGIGGPIVHFPGGHLPTQPIMLLSSPPFPPPTDEELKRIHLTREAFEKDKAETQAAIEKDFQSCSGGAYRVTIQLPGFSHNSFTDMPLLRAIVARSDTVSALQSLQLAESYTVAFFDRFLKGTHSPLLDSVPAKDVHIRRYMQATIAR